MFYLELFQKLESANIRYMLVGGLAMNLYGVPRSTMDVDIVLAMDQGNLRAFFAMAKQMNMQPVAPVSMEDFLDPVVRKSWVKDKNEDLITLKEKTGRAQDRADIEHLKRLISKP